MNKKNEFNGKSSGQTFDEEVEALLCAEPGLAAAADALYEVGKHHGWFPAGLGKTWRDMDVLGQLEFLEIVGSIIDAYKKSPKNAPAPSQP